MALQVPTAHAGPGAADGVRDPLFRRVLCAVNGTRASSEAVRQALVLTAPGGLISFLAVTDDRGHGLVEQSSLGRQRATSAVDTARHAATEAGIAADVQVVTADEHRRVILDAARGHDLLVIGTHGGSRAAGIFLGSTASFAVHTSDVPVLVARARRDVEFPGTVLAASAGSGDLETCKVAALIAAAHGGSVVLGHAGTTVSKQLHDALTEQSIAIMEVTGTEPVVRCETGDPADRLPEMADAAAAGLMVVGSSGRRGAAALASVSERVAHRAHCAVLVLRHPAAAV